MIDKDLKKYKLPDEPGVYFFLGPLAYSATNSAKASLVKKASQAIKSASQILYIGKATSLKDRVKSYFPSVAKAMEDKRGPKIAQMVKLANKLDWQETDSVLEALLLETELIKKHQPPYNTREKDDKSYWYVVITDEDFPRVLPIRGRVLTQMKNLKISQKFGPYPYASEIKEALKIIRRIFPYRDKCEPNSGKACFNRQIGLCPGVCTGEISKNDYRKVTRNLTLFFAGKKKEITKNLEREMKSLAKKQEFEKASKIRNQIFALNHIQDISLLKNKNISTQGGANDSRIIRIEAYDIAHLSGKNTTGAMTVWQNGELDKSEYKRFKLRGLKANRADDPANLREILTRRFNHPEWAKPDLIVVDGNQVQTNVVCQVLNEFNLADIKVVSVVKNEKHRAGKLLGDPAIIHDYYNVIITANSEAHRFALNYHRQLRSKVL